MNKYVAVCRMAVKSVAIEGARGCKVPDKEGSDVTEQLGLETGGEDEARRQRQVEIVGLHCAVQDWGQ